MRKPSYDGAQERFIQLNSQDFTVKELSKALGLTIAVIHNVGIKYRLTFKAPTYAKQTERAKPLIPKPVPAKFVRPAAIYNQSASPYGIASSIRHL